MNYDDLDPGIRETVRRLNAAGFETSDSGDGVSKDGEERVLDVAHVVIVAKPETLIEDSKKLCLFLLSHGISVQPMNEAPEHHPAIQSTFDPVDNSAIMMLFGVNDASWTAD